MLDRNRLFILVVSIVSITQLACRLVTALPGREAIEPPGGESPYPSQPSLAPETPPHLSPVPPETQETSRELICNTGYLNSPGLAGLILKDPMTPSIARVAADGSLCHIFGQPAARISPDGRLAVYEDMGDLWIADLPGGQSRNLTATPDVNEANPQWWPANPGVVIFSIYGAGSSQVADAGRVGMIQVDGSERTEISDIVSIGLPALSPDGTTLAFDQQGMPWLYDINFGGTRFDFGMYGYPTTWEGRTGSPAWSPDGQKLAWWTETAGPGGPIDLVIFDRKTYTSSVVHTYSPLVSTTWWPAAPGFSPNGKWVAFITRDEFSPVDLFVTNLVGSDVNRFGLATDPVWSPQGDQLIFTQWPPRSAVGETARVERIDLATFTTTPLDFPAGSIPMQWYDVPLPAEGVLHLPMFTPPSNWLGYTHPETGFEIFYPPDASLLNINGAVEIRLPVTDGSQMEVKSLTIDARPVVQEACYSGLEWQGSIMINGVEYRYSQGPGWESSMGGLSFFRSDYATLYHGMCYRVALRMAMRDDSGATGSLPKPTPSRADLDPEVILDILTTLKVQ